MQRRNIKLDFVGVGAAKSGTSWLSTCLGEHPEVCMAEPKELNYFCEKAIWSKFQTNNTLGPEWLANRFVHCTSGQRLGEFSPNYLCDPRSPDLIFLHNPGCRLIFCFRHPVEAVASYYYQVRKESAVADSLEDFLNENPEIYRMGLYHHHMQAFLNKFPREQCIFLLFDDIQRDPAATMQRCFSFLGVTSDFVPASLLLRVNESQTPRSRWVAQAITAVRVLKQKHASNPVQKWLWKIQLHRLHTWIMRSNLRSFTPPPIKESTRQQLIATCRDDMRMLGAFLGRDLSNWER